MKKKSLLSEMTSKITKDLVYKVKRCNSFTVTTLSVTMWHKYFVLIKRFQPIVKTILTSTCMRLGIGNI